MNFTYKINHLIPGRIRLTIPALANMKDYTFIEETSESMVGINHVRIVPMIQSMVIEYDKSILNHQQILQFIGVFFQKSQPVKFDMKTNLLRSGISGLLLLIAFLRKNKARVTGQTDTFDYLAAITTTGTTLLSHGDYNRLNHPDVIGGIISMISLGPEHILQVALVTWAVNLIEVFNDWRRNSQFLYQ